jgi:nucleoside-diphosphate-sugar epimerase
MSKKALVTGCCGFIGSSLMKQLLSHGWVVEGVDDLSSGDLESLQGIKVRPVLADFLYIFESKNSLKPEQSLVINGDFTHDVVLERIRSGTYDAVFHLAAQPNIQHCSDYPIETYENNMHKSIALFYTCIKNVKSVVFASSAAVYGDTGIGDYPVIPEDSVPRPLSAYGMQKLHVEQYTDILSSAETSFACLRVFNVYGPGQTAGVIAEWCRSAKSSSPLVVHGTGNQTRDFCYIDDVVDAFILVAQNNVKPGNVKYNVGSGVSISMNDVLHHLKKYVPDVIISYAESKPADITHSQADVTKINKALNYNPRTQFLYGLKETLTWWGLNED